MTTEQRAAILADPRFPRGYYARAILDGRQRLSGSDLRGKAQRFSFWYRGITRRVLTICRDYGVFEARGPHGLRYLP